MEHEPKGSGKTGHVTLQWVMEAHYSNVAVDMRRDDVVQPAEAAKVGSEASIISTPTKLNVIPTAAELPLSLSIAPSANAASGHNGIRLEIVSLCKR